MEDSVLYLCSRAACSLLLGLAACGGSVKETQSASAAPKKELTITEAPATGESSRTSEASKPTTAALASGAAPAEAPRAAAAATGPAPAKAPEAANCDPKRVDWQNREYPPSKLTSQSFKLSKGWYKFNIQKVDPDTNMGNAEKGDAYSLTKTEFGDFDGDGVTDALLGLSKRDFGVFHGNRPDEDLPWVGYVFHMSANCEPEFAGTFSAQADEWARAADGKLVVLLPNKTGAKRREFRIEAGKLNPISDGQIDAEAFKAYLTPIVEKKCDEARVRAGLPSDPAQKPWRGANPIRVSDPCVTPRLDARLGKRADAFNHNYTTSSGALKANGSYLIGTGCRAHMCAWYGSAFAIDTRTWVVDAAIIERGKVEWITAANQPPEELKAVVEEIRQGTLQP